MKYFAIGVMLEDETQHVSLVRAETGKDAARLAANKMADILPDIWDFQIATEASQDDADLFAIHFKRYIEAS